MCTTTSKNFRQRLWRREFSPFGGVNGHSHFASVMETGLVRQTRGRCPGGTLPHSRGFAGPEGPEARSSPTEVSGADRIRISGARVTGRPGPPPRRAPGGATQAAGTYSGTFDVTVNYN